jgi:phosphate ABC transporter permease protein PstC
MESGSITTGGRAKLQRSPGSRSIDPIVQYALTGVAALFLLLIGYFFVRLFVDAKPAFDKFGYFGFAFRSNWDVAHNIYGALPLLVGSVICSAIALVIGVPVAVSVAVYVTEFCPARARAPLTALVELLAAVPSVVYGLWGVFILIPSLKPIEEWIASTFGFLPLVGATVAGPNLFIGGLILAIMIVPIVSAISREVMLTVPLDHKEAALALGATRWEMVRIAVLPWSRSGVAGAAMLGLGRAIGETIAVLLVIGNSPSMPKDIFGQGYTLAAVIANEFGEAASQELHRAALIAAGLLLFVLTLIVNALARFFVKRAERSRTFAVAAPETNAPTAIV